MSEQRQYGLVGLLLGVVLGLCVPRVTQVAPPKVVVQQLVVVKEVPAPCKPTVIVKRVVKRVEKKPTPHPTECVAMRWLK